MIMYVFVMVLFSSQFLLSMENDLNSKLGIVVKGNSLESFRPKNDIEELNENQEVAFREKTPRKRLRYALLKKVLGDNKTCVLEVGNKSGMIAGRTLPLQDLYVRTSSDKSLGNKILLQPSEVKSFDDQTFDGDLVLLKGKDDIYQWVKIKKVLPDNQYAVLINQKQGIISTKKELFTLINESKIPNSPSNP